MSGWQFTREESLQWPAGKYILGKYLLPEGCWMLYFFPPGFLSDFPQKVGLISVQAFFLTTPSLHPRGARKPALTYSVEQQSDTTN